MTSARRNAWMLVGLAVLTGAVGTARAADGPTGQSQPGKDDIVMVQQGPAGKKTIVVHGPVHLKGLILLPDGSPAGGANIVVNRLNKKIVPSQVTVVTDSSGRYDIPTMSPFMDGDMMTVSTAGATAYVFPNCSSVINGQDQPTIALRSPTTLRFQLLDSNEKPLPGLHVLVRDLKQTNGLLQYFRENSSPWSTTSDDQGWVTFANLPQGEALTVAVSAPGYVEPQYSDVHYQLDNSAATSGRAIHLSLGGSVSGVVTYSGTNQPVAHLSVRAQSPGNTLPPMSGLTDSTGHYRIDGLVPGVYDLITDAARENSPAQGWVSSAHTATVAAGGEPATVNFTLIHGSTITGRFTDKRTGQPIAGVSIGSINDAGGSSATTDADGRYTMHVAPGAQRIYAAGLPGMPEIQQQFFSTADGEVKTLDFQSTLPLRSMHVNGIVVDSSGRPVPDASVFTLQQAQGESAQQLSTDSGGHFEFAQPVYADQRVYVRTATSMLQKGVAPSSKGDTVVRVPSAPPRQIQGTVVDEAGNPIPNATVTLFDQMDSYGISVGVTATTDAQGRYTMAPPATDVTYSFSVAAEKYAVVTALPKVQFGAVGNAIAAPIKLVKADSYVGGTVIDPSGNPIPGATVSAMQIGNHTITDAHGRFHLADVTRDKVILDVRAPGNRWRGIEVSSATDDNVITASNQNEVDAESKRFVALRDADTTNHGDGTSANTLLRNAEQKASQGDKAVFLTFHASWCGPCFMLHRFLNDPQVKPIMDAHFVVQDIDIWEDGSTKPWENPGGTDLYKKYGGVKADGGQQGVPYFVLLDPAGAKLADSTFGSGDNVGFPTETPDKFMAALKTAAPSLTDAEVATLRAQLKSDSKL